MFLVSLNNGLTFHPSPVSAMNILLCWKNVPALEREEAECVGVGVLACVCECVCACMRVCVCTCVCV